MTERGSAMGQPEDAGTGPIANLAGQFEPLGEEPRQQATRELFESPRRRNEAGDALFSRFLALRFQATRD
eukprot:7679391-Pyramimonas_sp.AAC.1